MRHAQAWKQNLTSLVEVATAAAALSVVSNSTVAALGAQFTAMLVEWQTVKKEESACCLPACLPACLPPRHDDARSTQPLAWNRHRTGHRQRHLLLRRRLQC